MITGSYLCSAAVFSEIHEGLNKRQLRISHGWACHVGSRGIPDQASLPQPQNRKPIKTAPCPLCKPDVPWNQNDKFIAGPFFAKLMSWCFFGSNPWDLSNTLPIWIFFTRRNPLRRHGLHSSATGHWATRNDHPDCAVATHYTFLLWDLGTLLTLLTLLHSIPGELFLDPVVGPTPWAWYLGHDLWGTWRNRWTSHPSIPDGCHKASQTQLSSTDGSAQFISKRAGIWDPWCVWDWDGFTSLYHIISCYSTQTHT